MALFLVIAPEPAGIAPYEEMIKRQFPNDHLVIGPNVWAVSFSGISKDVVEKIITPPVAPGAPTMIVVSVSGYYGLAQNSVWEWFANKMSASNGR